MERIIFKSVTIFLIILLSSCKKDDRESISLSNENQKIDSLKITNSNLFEKELTQIVRKDEKFMLSCASTYNKISLKNNTLHLEIIEPIDYEVKKIEETNKGFKIFLKEQEFYYEAILEDERLGIYNWKNYSISNNKVNDDYSFYAIENSNLQKAKLEKENCEQDTEISTWVGKYHLELTSTHGDGTEVLDRYELKVNDLKNIEFSSENFKFIISGEFYNENEIQGDILKVIKNKKNITTSFSPFIILTKEGNTFYITCPLITQGAGFSSTPYEIEKM
jgi:hypothetical protein